MASGSRTQVSRQSRPEELPFVHLKAITKNFSDELGKGTFGSVYKGILDGGFVAVKKFGADASVPPEIIFTNEVHKLMELEHENIIKLVGYYHGPNREVKRVNGKLRVADITETLLCYEYLSNGGLHNFVESGSIDWNTRFKIILGICNGLHYLHNQPQRIAHLNLKPQNILLDGNFTPKITDFGFSRIFGQEKSRRITKSNLLQVGYMSPEYKDNQEISTQSDIYSLGILILEIITRKNNIPTEEKAGRKYIDRVDDIWMKDDEKIMSEYEQLDEYQVQQVQECIKIGLQCVEINPKKRLSIDQVVKQLNGE